MAEVINTEIVPYSMVNEPVIRGICNKDCL